MLARGERLDSLVEKSSDLSISSQVGIFLLCIMLYKDSTCSTTECCRNAYVAMDLWSHKNGPSSER